MICLSKSQINSFCGDVLPLRLLGVEEFGMEDIEWKLEGDCVRLKKFSGPAEHPADDGGFTDGVLLTLLYPGEACVTATYKNVPYTCSITVREIKKVSSEEAVNFYLSDMHIHTSNACAKAGARKILTGRTDNSSPYEVVRQIREEGILGMHVISDHSDLLDRKEFFRGFLAAEESGVALSTFAGSECDIFSIEKDRYGVIKNNANEVVCINADTFIAAHSYREFLDAYSKCPYIVCTLAHPQFYGHNTNGKGEFSLYKNCTARFRQMVKFVELGDGSDRGGNLFHEYVYSSALDSGFHISTTCSSDSHGPVWGYQRIPGNTVFMAKENTKEAYLDALQNHRAYACMSGNVKLRYSVNGYTAPATLPLSNHFCFQGEISYFYDDPETVIVGGEVISNGGVTVKELNFEDFSTFAFELDSDSSSWYYLRLWDKQGRKTWSVPVYTGREPYLTHDDDLTPLDKENMKVTDEKTGEDASILICDDPYQGWTATDTTASLLIDLSEETTICGLSHYCRVLIGKQMKAVGPQPKSFLAELPFRYRISTSVDGVAFENKAEGVFRNCSGEEIVRLPKHKARWIRLEILSTAGYNSRRKEFMSAPVTLGEITVYRKYENAEMREYFVDRIQNYPNYLLKENN